jgi:IrrE N-terminal-like domain
VNAPTINTNTKGVVKTLRAMVPLRPLTASEAYGLAERQAGRALQTLGIREPGLSLGWVTELPRVEVRPTPRYKMHGLSGVTNYSHGRYLILVTKNDAHARRRWTLAHELKHVIDYTTSKVMYRSLGYGDELRRELQVERICDHFAASLLMPRAWVKEAYACGIQDVPALAGLFNVSEEAMHIRLNYLGLIDDEPDRPVRTYFRRAGWLREWGPAPGTALDFSL